MATSSRRELLPPWAEDALCAGVFLACLIYSLVSAGIGWNNTLLGPHGFRQTQTALSTYYMLEGGPWLAYETPVLGAPWRIPFELPLYQWIVALIVTCSGAPLDQAGRFADELFFYATSIPAYALLGSLRVRPAHRLLFLSLLLVSPQYVYWSRAFMIESTALFCAMSYLALAVRALDRRRPGSLMAAALFGALAAMVKVTSYFAFLLAAMLFLVDRWWRTGSPRLSTVMHSGLWIAAAAVLPLACGAWWTGFTDALKEANPLAAGFITSAALTDWNFGTAAQRFSGRMWMVMWDRTLPDVVGHGSLVVAAALIVLAGRRRLALFLVCIALFLSPPLTFTNLYLVHNYYAYANGVFLIAAIGWCSVGCLEREDRWKWLGAAVLVCAIGASVWRYQLLYVPVQSANLGHLLDTAMVVQSSTTPDEVILVLGLDWNSELPYYARRRALMNRDGRPPEDPKMRRALANLGERPLGAMVVCAGAVGQRSLIASWLQTTGLSPAPRRTTACEVYTRGA